MTMRQSATADRQPSRARRQRRRDRTYAVAISPAAILLAVFFAAPAVWAVYSSTTDLSLFGFSARAPSFVGLGNYRRLWNDPDFPRVAWNTIMFVFWSAVIGQTLGGLALAILLNHAKERGYRLADVAFAAVLLAWISPPLLTAFIWGRLLDYRGGVIDGALAQLGVDRVRFLGDHAMTSVIAVEIWKGIGFAALVFLGALQTVPKQVLEAARCDGAGAFARFRDHILPALRNVVALVLTMTTIVSSGSFLTILLLTNGDPGMQTETLALYGFHRGFSGLEIGFGAAISTVLLVANAVFAAVYLGIGRRRR
jgi:multiple sugar transport system permease protein